MIVAYLQWWLVVVALIFLIGDKCRLRRLDNKLLVLLVMSVLMLLPFGAIPTFGYFWGVLGQISITSTFLIICYVFINLPVIDKPLFQIERRYLFAPIAIMTLVFYPLSLGFSPIDPYGWGFEPFYLAITLLIVAVALWVGEQRILAWLLLALVACHQMDLLESDNLWDYLLDPFLAFYSLGWVMQRMKEYFRARLIN